MRKITIAIALLTLFSCTKQDISNVENVENAKVKVGTGALYLSETYIDGKLTSKNIYDNGKAVKTLSYYGSSSAPSEMVYEYDPANRKVVFNQEGFVRTYFYDELNRPIQQDFYSSIIIDYFYEKDNLSRLLYTIRSGADIRSVSDYRYIYKGKWLERITVNDKSFIPYNYERQSTYIANWLNPYNYTTFAEGFPNQATTYRYSTTIKAPDYNFNITPFGFDQSENNSKRDLIHRSGLAFLSPAHGMLQLEYQDGEPATTKIYLENIITNKDKLPLSYDQVTESGGTTTRKKYEFKYLMLGN